LILTALPTPPRKVDTSTLQLRLRLRGIEVHRRTIQRDLLDLARVFPIVADERRKPYGWRWSSDALSWLLLQLHPTDRPSGRHVEVTLHGRSDALRAFGELASAGNRGPRTADDPIRTITVTLPVEDAAPARRFLLAQADQVEVVAPADLRRAIADAAARIHAKHARSL
jgi:predicted DNA-binding transcriptional regulator YafY